MQAAVNNCWRDTVSKRSAKDGTYVGECLKLRVEHSYVYCDFLQILLKTLIKLIEV